MHLIVTKKTFFSCSNVKKRYRNLFLFYLKNIIIIIKKTNLSIKKRGETPLLFAFV